MAESLAARLKDAGELRAFRAGVGVVLPRPSDLLAAAAVCAAVEAFQAAEQEKKSALADWKDEKNKSQHHRLISANEQLEAAKARLLEVNLE